MRDLRNRALLYARHGLPVVPMHTTTHGRCSCGRGEACSSPGKHPRTAHGVNDATTDRKLINKWWREWPKANIGIAVGEGPGLIALDIDPRHNGEKTLSAKEAELGKLPNTVTSLTGGGGRHLIYKQPGFKVRKDSHGKFIGRGVDVLASGSIMIVPPSRHASGGRYRWKEGQSIFDITPVKLPAKWQDALRAGQNASSAQSPEAEDSERIREGHRNNHLTSVAGRLQNTGISRVVLRAALLAENERVCTPPLDKSEVRKIAKSVSRYPVKELDPKRDLAEQLMLHVLHEHFADGKQLLHCIDGRFWYFDGRKWQPLNIPPLQQRILKTLENGPEQRTHSKSALLGQIVNLLRAKVATADDVLCFLGEPPNVINCANGELWILPGGKLDLQPHRANSHLRDCLSINYDPDAECPRYDEAVLQIFSKASDPKKMVRHWHELCGFFLAPRRTEPKIVVLRGTGSNGKTKLMGTVAKVMGEDLVAYFRVESLENNRFAIGSLLGKKLMVDDDVGAGTRLPDGELKKISEPKPLTGERKHGAQFNFVIRTVPVLLCNNVPSVADLTEGMQRRLMVIPFDQSFKNSANPVLFPEIWTHELPGILNRFLKGLRRLSKRGRFKEPTDVREATAKLLRDANPLPGFLDDRCSRDPQASCLMRDLYKAYCDWCTEMGITKTQQQPNVRRNLVHLGYKEGHGNKGNKVYGLKLR